MQVPSVGFNRPALVLRRNILCLYNIFFNFLSSSDRWNARTDLLPTRVVEVSATGDGISRFTFYSNILPHMSLFNFFDRVG